MPVQRTVEQDAAVTARNPALLVSASAGSGKTFVLVERIRELVREDGLDIRRMLIVTFTRAAAAEMRTRIARRFQAEADDPRMRAQADYAENADVSTLHVFCQKLVRAQFQAVDIDPRSRICDEATGAALFEEALTASLDAAYEAAFGGAGDAGDGNDGESADADGAAPPSPFRRDDAGLRGLLSKWKEADIRRMVARLTPFLLSLPEPWAWLERAVQAGGDLAEGPLGQAYLKEARICVSGLTEITDAECALMRGDMDEKTKQVVLSDAQLADALTVAAARGQGALSDAVAAAAFARHTTARNLPPAQVAVKESVKALRDLAKELMKTLRALTDAPDERALSDTEAMRPCAAALGVIVRDTNARFQRLKRARGLHDFSDLEHMSLRILSDPTLRAEVQKRYDAVFVDEYQDISAIQDAILQKLTGGGASMFMVGDVKQSIYRFRLADPTLFLRKLRTFSPAADADARKILLNRNFRSDPRVLDAVNRVFASAMRANVTELDYGAEAWLYAGREDAPDDRAPRVALTVYPYRRGGAAAALSQEALGAARRIGRLVAEGVAYKDIAILLPRAKGMLDVVTETLTAHGIPFETGGGAATLQAPEVAQTLACLKLADHPTDDETLLAVLRGPLFAMTEEELAAVRLRAPERGVTFGDAFARCAADWEARFEAIRPLPSPEDAARCAPRPFGHFTDDGGAPAFAEEYRARYRDWQRGADGLGQTYRGAEAFEPAWGGEKGSAGGAGVPPDDAGVPPNGGGAGVPPDGAGVPPDGAADESGGAGVPPNGAGARIAANPAWWQPAALPSGVTLTEDDRLSRRCYEILRVMTFERFLLQKTPLHEYLWGFLKRSGLYDHYAALPGGRARLVNLRLLCTRAYEHVMNEDGAPDGFLQTMERASGGDGGEASGFAESDTDAVRVMTIHKSKGLEFPVVFLMGLSDSLTKRGDPSPLTFHAEMGLALPFVDEQARVTRPTYAVRAIASRQEMEQCAERARLLYVGMTRAKERLFMSGCLAETGAPKCWVMRLGDYRVYAAKSMLDWIAQAVMRGEDADALRALLKPEQARLLEMSELSTEGADVHMNSTGLSTDSTGYPQSYAQWNIAFEGEEAGKTAENAEDAGIEGESEQRPAAGEPAAGTPALSTAGSAAVETASEPVDNFTGETDFRDAPFGRLMPEAVRLAGLEDAVGGWTGVDGGTAGGMASFDAGAAGGADAASPIPPTPLPSGAPPVSLPEMITPESAVWREPSAPQTVNVTALVRAAQQAGFPLEAFAAGAGSAAGTGNAANASSAAATGFAANAGSAAGACSAAATGFAANAGSAAATGFSTSASDARPSPLPPLRVLTPRPLSVADKPDRPDFLGAPTVSDAIERGLALHRALKLLPLDPLRALIGANGRDASPDWGIVAAIRQGIAVPAGSAGASAQASATAQASLVPAGSKASAGQPTFPSKTYPTPNPLTPLLDDLLARGVVSPAERAFMDDDLLLAFFASALGRRMLQSPLLYREQNFSLRLPDLGVPALQGVVDVCFLEDGEWVVYDYKSAERGSPERIAARYRPQVALYRRALADITGVPVRECGLYLLDQKITICVESGA